MRGNLRLLVGVMIVVAGAVPVGIYWATIGRAPSITASQALALRDAADGATVLIDIRPVRAFASLRVRGSVNWPLEKIHAAVDPDDVPEAIRGKRWVFLCDSGLLSVSAVRRAEHLGALDAVLVHDGLAAFNVIDRLPIPADVMEKVYAGSPPGPYRDSPWYEEWSLFLTGFVVKPVYMLLSFILIVALWRQRARDLAALRWGLIFFLAGEAACAVNYLAFSHESHFSEFLHSYGMVVAFAFFTYALLEGVDTRVVHVSSQDTRCVLLALCPACAKHSDVPCVFRRVFKFLIAALLVTSLISFCTHPQMVSYNTKILLTAYSFTHPAIYQIFESRYCPILAILLFALSYGALVWGKDAGLQMPKILFSAGVGAFSFGLFRLILFGMFTDNLVWFNSWEEITELLLIAGIAFVLYILRQRLFDRAE